MAIYPGDIVAIRVLGVIWHIGIVTHRGTVISASLFHRGVVELDFSEFGNGKPISRVGYPGALPPNEVIARAISKLDQPWNLFNANCEHFAYWAHGLKPQSPQLKQAAGAIALVAFAGLLARA